MRFSMARLMGFTGFVSLLLAAAFAMPPWLGLLILTVVSLLFLPQLIWIGAFNTKGRTRAFFIGCILGGIPHFLVSVFLLTNVVYALDFDVSGDPDEVRIFNYIHLGGLVIGLCGGLSGIFAHWLIVPKATAEAPTTQAELTQTYSGPFESEHQQGNLRQEELVSIRPK